MQDNNYVVRGMVLAFAASAVLTGCGGGGDLENGVTDLTVSPNATTVTSGSSTVCLPAPAGKFFIYGGTSPYTVQNSAPAYMTISTSRVEDVGGSFDVQLLGGCIADGVINVTDKFGRLAVVKITNQLKQDTTPVIPQ
ncbi:hypothetical protein R82526_04078 [Ralstonia mannitolilytica]|uniref:hypothetical protein n=1 Tax=Ralstonia mannitolilytica TaxID=105219 RepID=UPI000A861EF5|nr:hypothetical protein [Ralstonia mannitolilytica]CAJ0693979.1 hypothetical protein R82526_04078 [Ralstonia mannitolilytica]CAJ0890993.1 hypothetical protein R76727_04229 [Ralstonia mannitolilytica]